MRYEKFLRSCKVHSAVKNVWSKGASSIPIKSERFIITFHFTGTSTFEIERHGTRKEVESFAQMYSKTMFTEKEQQPFRISINNF